MSSEAIVLSDQNNAGGSPSSIRMTLGRVSWSTFLNFKRRKK
jgi:hypothetical protein